MLPHLAIGNALSAHLATLPILGICSAFTSLTVRSYLVRHRRGQIVYVDSSPGAGSSRLLCRQIAAKEAALRRTLTQPSSQGDNVAATRGKLAEGAAHLAAAQAAADFFNDLEQEEAYQVSQTGQTAHYSLTSMASSTDFVPQ